MPDPTPDPPANPGPRFKQLTEDEWSALSKRVSDSEGLSKSNKHDIEALNNGNRTPSVVPSLPVPGSPAPAGSGNPAPPASGTPAKKQVLRIFPYPHYVEE